MALTHNFKIAIHAEGRVPLEKESNMKNIEEERSMRSVGQERPVQSPTQERSIQPNRENRSAQSPSSVQERSIQSPTGAGDLQEAVRVRAYQIYEQRRGTAGGSEIEDWLQAEVEILPNRTRQKAA